MTLLRKITMATMALGLLACLSEPPASPSPGGVSSSGSPASTADNRPVIASKNGSTPQGKPRPAGGASGPDADGDGIPDAIDQCPHDPEDRDGFQDDDGCPDPDNDGDGIRDRDDRCPNEPETMNGFQDEDGCPDTIPDADGDGIPDVDDKCPTAGGSSVIRARGNYYGCPDRDQDGIPDMVDKCPDVPEDTDGFQDDDGCPDPDNDGDGVRDDADECVDVPGPASNHGCPVSKPGPKRP